MFFFGLIPGAIALHVNSLELEPVILHGICYILTCSPTNLHSIWYTLALQHIRNLPWYLPHAGTSNVHVGFFEVSFGFHLGFL